MKKNGANEKVLTINNEEDSLKKTRETLFTYKSIEEKSDPVISEKSIKLDEITYIPTVFVSYSHDNDDHKKWVLNFAENLMTEGGINTILDQWELDYGDSLSNFMEQINFADKIIIVCSPLYKEKADNIKDGVGYEKRIIVEKLIRGEFFKVIPITPFDRELSTPLFLSDLYMAVFTDANYDKVFIEVVRNIYGRSRIAKPQLGQKSQSLFT